MFKPERPLTEAARDAALKRNAAAHTKSTREIIIVIREDLKPAR